MPKRTGPRMTPRFNYLDTGRTDHMGRAIMYSACTERFHVRVRSRAGKWYRKYIDGAYIQKPVVSLVPIASRTLGNRTTVQPIVTANPKPRRHG